MFAILLAGPKAQAQTYGVAGCGLGSIVIGPGDGFSQVFAATTNATSFSQTLGITSGTSNCQRTDGSADARRFIETNRETFAKDMARGQGETITALSRIAGCSDAGAVGATLQSEFTSIVPNAATSDAHVGDNVVQLLRTRSELACTELS